MAALTSIIVAVVLVQRCWRAAHRHEGNLAPGEHLLVFLLMTGTFCTGAFSLGLNLSAWRMLAYLIIMGAFVCGCRRSTRSQLTLGEIPVILFTAYLLWSAYRLLAAPSIIYGARSFPKALYPFLILLLARNAARPGRLGVYVVPMVGASLIVSVFSSDISASIPYLCWNPLWNHLFYSGSAFDDHAAIIIGAILTIMWTYGNRIPGPHRKIYILGVMCLTVSPVVGGTRTGILANIASISGYLLVRYKFKALPFVALLLLTGVMIPFLVGPVGEKMFFGRDRVTLEDVVRGDLSVDEVNSSGRFDIWERVLVKFYRPHRLVGSGIGAVQEEMYTRKQEYGGLTMAHSDYVVLLCETGLIGLFLYLSAVGAALLVAVRYVCEPTTLECRAAGTLVISSFLAFLCAAAFDNAMAYSSAVQSLPFAFTGILLGMVNNLPSSAIEDPWLWSHEYIWSSFLTGRRSRFEPMLLAPPMYTGRYAHNQIQTP